MAAKTGKRKCFLFGAKTFRWATRRHVATATITQCSKCTWACRCSQIGKFHSARKKKKKRREIKKVKRGQKGQKEVVWLFAENKATI